MSGDGAAISLVLTTYGADTWYTQRCLARIAEWKTPRHELIVVVHDETPLLRAYLEHCRRTGLVDLLLSAVPGHGHVRGVNLGFARTCGGIIFNICNDMLVGPGVVDACVARLRSEPRTGMIAWHYDWAPDHEGTFWHGERLDHAVRGRTEDATSREDGWLNPEHVANISAAPWFSNRVFAALGTRRLLLPNGSFFGIRRELWQRLGGYDEQRYPHSWADDFLAYGVLELGYDIANLPPELRAGRAPERFLALSDRPWQGQPDPKRHCDELEWTPWPDYANLDWREAVLVDVIVNGLPPGAAVAVAGDSPLDLDDLFDHPPDVLSRDPLPSAVGPYDAIFAPRRRYAEQLIDALGEGGVLVVLGPEGEPAPLPGQGTVGVLRKEPPRLGFVRNSDTTARPTNGAGSAA
jgi:GT2 family glycosyltransferase